jgi:Ca-activated chloride channel homolog
LKHFYVFFVILMMQYSKQPKISKWFILLSLALVVLCIICWIYAGKKQQLADYEKKEVVFLLDISKSMLATDVQPNRFQRAINFIKDYAEVADYYKMGIVTFNKLGNTELPLVNDKGLIQFTLNSFGDNLLNGTSDVNIGLRSAIHMFNKFEPTSREIVILSDGEMHETFIDDITQEAIDNEIVISANIIGTESGATMPDNQSNDFVKDKSGAVVTSKANYSFFNNIVQKTQGVTLSNGSANDILKRKLVVKEQDKAQGNSYWHIILICITVLLLLLEFVFRAFRKPKYYFTSLLYFICISANAQVLDEKQVLSLIANKDYVAAKRLVNAKNMDANKYAAVYKAFLLQTEGNHKEAYEMYKTILPLHEKDVQEVLNYNKAVAAYYLKNIDEAIGICKGLLMANGNDNDARILLQKAMAGKKEKSQKEKVPEKEPSPQFDKMINDLKEQEKRIKRRQQKTPQSNEEKNW